MKKYWKKAKIEVLKEYTNGNRLVRNEGDNSDIWIIPKDVFEKTYEEVKERGLKDG